jgi:predicted N-acetyltransferase YhbS
MESISLPDGYILRNAAPSDIDGVFSLVRTNLFEEEWARVLIDGSHPTTNLSHWTVVENYANHQIVSTMCRIPQTWTYAGIPFGVARMDMVATDPAHRWKGLVRAQFRALEAESTRQGDWIQVVVGRPYVYRRLGYTMALPFRLGVVEVSRQGISSLQKGETEPFRVRPALETDLPYWTELFRRDNDNALVACRRELVHWQHDIFERKVEGRIQLRIIEDARAESPTFGQPVGGMAHAEGVNEGILPVFACVIEPGIPWLEAAPSILGYLLREGERYTARDGGEINGFSIGQGHPMLAALTDHMQRIPPEGPFAWYIRLPDPAGFLLHIAPVLNRRMVGSVIDGWTGELKLDFYAGGTLGLTLVIENGCLTRAKNTASGHGNPSMPFEFFLKILFGYRSVEEVEAECAEVALNGRSRAILKALFPKQLSRILSIA